MNRSESYDQEISIKLKSKRFAQSFIEGLMEGSDGLSVEEALKQTISRMGIKEFCQAADIPTSNVQEFLKGKRKPKPETLDIYLKPFGLKTKVTLEKAS